jgi:hypothetical protein
MLGLILTLVVVAGLLAALLWFGTTLGQTYIYDSPADGLAWRVPAAVGIIWLFVAAWTFIEYAHPGSTDTVFEFTNEVRTPVTRFWSIRHSDTGDEEVVYERRGQGHGAVEFRDKDGRTWSRSSSGSMVALIVEEKTGGDTKRTRFNAEMKDGKFAPRAPRGAEMPLRYMEEGGSRYIEETQLGMIVSYKSGRLIWVVLINVIHLALWFAVLWPLLRFQWVHALGFAVVIWLVLTLALIPFLLGRARDAAAKKHAARPAAAAGAFPATYLVARTPMFEART